jgi:hypothetical protein
LIIRGFWHTDIETAVKKRERGEKVNAAYGPVNSKLDKVWKNRVYVTV